MANVVDIVISGHDETSGAIGSVLSNVKGLSAGIAAGIAAATAVVVGLGVAAFAIGSEFDDAYDKIRVGTGRTGDALGGLENSFKRVVSDVPASFDDASSAITTLNQKLGLTGPNLENLAKQELNLAHITKTDVNENIKASAAVFENWGVTAADQGSTLDFLFRTTQQTGIGFSDLSSELAANGVKLRELGFSLEEAAAMFGGLSKAGVDAGAVMPSFSRALATAAKEGKNAKDVLTETWQKIAEAPDLTAAAGIAVQVFGAKAGPQMAGLIREGKLAVGDLEDAIAGGSDTINQAAADTEDFGEKWTRFANRLKVAVEPVASAVFEGIGRAMDALAPTIEQVGAWFADKIPKAIDTLRAKWDEWAPTLSTGFDDAKDAVASFGAVITPIIDWMRDNATVTLVAFAAAVTGYLVPAFIAWAVAATNAAVATVAATWPILLIAAAVAALAAGLVYAYQHWDTFRSVVDTVVGFIRENAAPAFDSLKNALNSVAEALQPVWSWFQANSEVLARLGQGLAIVGAIIVGVVVVGLAVLVGALIVGALAVAALGVAIGAIIVVLYQLAQVIWDVFNNVREAIGRGVDAVEEWAQVVWDMANNVGTALANTVRAIWLVIQVVWDLANNTGTAMANVVRGVWNAIQVFWDLVQNVGSAIGRAVGFVAGLPASIASAVGDLGHLLWNAGASLINGLIDGIKSKIGGAIDTIRNGLASMRNLLPFSPAKEGPFSGHGWTSYSGASMMEGLAQGISSGVGGVRRAMGTAMAAATPALPAPGYGGLNAAGLAPGAGGGGGAAPIVHLHIAGSIRSDRELVRIMRDELINLGLGNRSAVDRPLVGR